MLTATDPDMHDTVKPLELLADIGVAARELRKLERADVLTAVRLMKSINPELYEWLMGALREQTS